MDSDMDSDMISGTGSDMDSDMIRGTGSDTAGDTARDGRERNGRDGGGKGCDGRDSVDRMAQLRQHYANAGLMESDLAADWLGQFRRWFDDAVHAGITEPNGMVLATASRDGIVSARSVLAKSVDARGVVFYTNYHSAKSRDLVDNPHAAVTFPWYSLQRQVHVRGTVTKVDRATTAQYWAGRPRGSQIGAWASPQSQPVADRAALDALQHEVEARFGGLDGTAPDAQTIPPPPQWGGWLITPATVEFWQGRAGRMHDRLRYRRDGSGWVIERLAP